MGIKVQNCTCAATCARKGRPFPTEWSWRCQELPYLQPWKPSNNSCDENGGVTICRPVMNPPAQAEAGNRDNTAPRQADPDAPSRGETGVSSGSEARPVTATEHRFSKEISLCGHYDTVAQRTFSGGICPMCEVERLTRELDKDRDASVRGGAKVFATLSAERDRLRVALERVKLHARSLADAQVFALEALAGEPDSAPEPPSAYQMTASEESSFTKALARKRVPDETRGWQPIETAPKDGRTLLLGYYNGAGKWRTLRGRWFEEGSIDEWDGADHDHNPAGWYETCVENDDLPNCWATEPTHWQPTPRPPSKASGEPT